MKKKILSVLLAAIMTMTIATVSFSAFAAETPTYKVDATVSADSKTLTVDVTLPGGVGAGGGFTIKYDHAKLKINSVDTEATCNEDFEGSGNIFVTFASANVYKKDKLVATIVFDVIDAKVSKADVSILSYTILNTEGAVLGSEVQAANAVNFVCPHTTKNWTVKQAATETEVGIEESICPVCGEVETRTIPKLVPAPTEAPTEATTAKKPTNNNPKTGAEGVTAKAIVALFSVATLAGVTVAGKKLTKKEK